MKTIQEAKEAKYFSLIVDTTLDTSHEDQLYIVFQYILNGEVKECFLCFVPIGICAGENVCEMFTSILQKNGIDITNGRGPDL